MNAFQKDALWNYLLRHPPTLEEIAEAIDLLLCAYPVCYVVDLRWRVQPDVRRIAREALFYVEKACSEAFYKMAEPVISSLSPSARLESVRTYSRSRINVCFRLRVETTMEAQQIIIEY